MNKKRRDQKGFTMVELVIVIAIMGIIGAVLVPSFSAMSTKARLATDISTVKTLKRTIDIYKAEKGDWPKTTPVDATDKLAGLNKTLSTDGYLDSDAVLKLSGANIKYDSDKGTIKLDISATYNSDKQLQTAYGSLDAQTKSDWVISGTETKTEEEKK